MNCDHAEKPVPLFRRSGGFKPTGHVETVPADDVVLDKPVAAFGNFLFDRVGMFETARVSDGDGPGETVREYRLVELPLDCLSQFDLIDIAQDEQGLDDLAEGFHGLVEAVLAGIRIQAPEYLGSRGFLELDRGDKAQQIIPGCSNHTFTDDRKGWRERSGFRSFPRGPSFCLPGAGGPAASCSPNSFSVVGAASTAGPCEVQRDPEGSSARRPLGLKPFGDILRNPAIVFLSGSNVLAAGPAVELSVTSAPEQHKLLTLTLQPGS